MVFCTENNDTCIFHVINDIYQVNEYEFGSINLQPDQPIPSFYPVSSANQFTGNYMKLERFEIIISHHEAGIYVLNQDN